MEKIVIDPFKRNVEERIAGRPGTERFDCVVRAFAIATARPYAEVHAILKRFGRKDRKGTFRITQVKAARQLKLRWVAERRTVAKFLDDMEFSKPVAAFIRGHAFAVEKGAVVDIQQVPPRCIVKGYYTL